MVTYETGCQRLTPRRAESAKLSKRRNLNFSLKLDQFAKFPSGKQNIISHQSKGGPDKEKQIKTNTLENAGWV